MEYSPQISSLFARRAFRRKSVTENTRMRTSTPSKLSSAMLARKMLALSADHVPSLVSVDASKVITRMRRMEAIRPTTRKGSVMSVCEWIEIRTVWRISTSIKNDKQMIF